MYKKPTGIFLLILTLFTPLFATSEESRVEHYPMRLDMQLPFSEAVRVDHMLYLSGMIGNLPGTSQLAEGGIQGQTRQTMENIKAALEKHGSSLGEVIKCTVFLSDIADWPTMNEVYIQYFRNDPPARSALGANGLALNSKVEIECLATVGID